MRHHDHGQPLLPLQIGKELQDLSGVGGIQVAGGFIGQQQGRLVNQGPGNGGPLHFTSGYLVGFVVPAVAEIDPHQPLPGQPQGLVGRRSPQDARQRHIFNNGQQGQQVKTLKDNTHLVPAVMRQLVFIKTAQVLSPK